MAIIMNELIFNELNSDIIKTYNLTYLYKRRLNFLNNLRLEYTGNGDELKIAGIKSLTTSKFIIPKYYAGKCIYCIGNYAFEGHQKLKCIFLPDSIKTIGASAFLNCQNLELVAMPSSIEGIQSSAFKNCRSLKLLEISPAVRYIEKMLFAIALILNSRLGEIKRFFLIGKSGDWKNLRSNGFAIDTHLISL